MSPERIKAAHAQEQAAAARTQLGRILIESPDFTTFWQRFDGRCLTELEQKAVKGIVCSVFGDVFLALADEESEATS